MTVDEQRELLDLAEASRLAYAKALQAQENFERAEHKLKDRLYWIVQRDAKVEQERTRAHAHVSAQMADSNGVAP